MKLMRWNCWLVFAISFFSLSFFREDASVSQCSSKDARYCLRVLFHFNSEGTSNHVGACPTPQISQFLLIYML